MKIVYMGTPDFAVPALEALAASGNEIGYVVSQPDAARDRGKKLKPTPVKAKAMELGLTVLQPEKIKNNEEFLQTLEDYAPDLIVVAAYGKIIPKEILELPRCGCINIHGSILPRWRGAAPIQRAVMEGDTETGITLMYMAEGLDTGDMIAVAKTPVAEKTSGQLHDELARLGAELLVSKLDDIDKGRITAEKQDDSLSCYAPMLSKKEGKLDFGKDAKKLACEVRGLDPWPGAFTYLNGELFKIWQAKAVENSDTKGLKPGTVLAADASGIDIATGKGILKVMMLQVPGKKRMSVEDYMRGNKIEIGTVLG